MQKTKGNIWHLVQTHWDHVVIPTNIGYSKQGTAVMSKGLAGQAAKRYPTLIVEYGDFCRKHKVDTPVTVMRPKPKLSLLPMPHLILFPTHPLNENFPYLSWRNPAEFALVDRSLQQLAELMKTIDSRGRVYIPDVGCGFGRLKVSDVRPLIEKHLGAFNNITHVVYQRPKEGR